MALDAAKLRLRASYLARHGSEFTAANVVDYMLFDAANPSSVQSCLATARSNARAVRTALTRDMWEALNTTYNELLQVDPAQLGAARLPEFLDWVRQRSVLFHGAMVNTILRNDTYYFSQLGTYIERADNTARILDVKYYMLLPETEPVGGEVDNWQWSQILRSVSAHRSYRWVYRDSLHAVEHRRVPDPARGDAALAALLLPQRSTQALDGLADDYGERHACHATRRGDRSRASPAATWRPSSRAACTSSSPISSRATTRSRAEIAAAYNFP